MKTLGLVVFCVIIDKVRKLKNNLTMFKYRVKSSWNWLVIINSPFKFPKPVFYAGKRGIGRPYFITKKKVDLQIMGLWYKSKFDQWRHEYSPRIILTVFGFQFAVFFGNNSMTDMSRWEAWLYYRDTPSNLDTLDRLSIVFDQYSAKWGNNESTTNYYFRILKNKYKSLLHGQEITIKDE